MKAVKKGELFTELQSDILRMEGFKPANCSSVDVALGPIKDAFPNASFPLGCVHEFLAAREEDAVATTGFIAGVLSSLMEINGTCLWISSSRTLFPPALKSFGIEPDRFIFIDLQKEKDIQWVVEEALKCSALTAVVGEMREISFTASRRLQLAVEQSQVTGFILRRNSVHINATAFVSRWQITQLPSETLDIPGIGFPKWRVELMRIRNGKPGSWDIQWMNRRFIPVFKMPSILEEEQAMQSALTTEKRKAG